MSDIPGGSFTLLGIYLAGLGLNLTPCVYPMFAVTVSLFRGGKKANHLEAFFRASLYVLGIAVMYSSLGVAAAFSGEVFGSLLQNPWVLAGLAVLLAALAMSLLGFYPLQFPGWMLKLAGDVPRAGLLGIFLSGLLVGIFAAPCIGAPIIALMAFVGTRGDPTFGFFVFFILSLGLGTPYLVLGTFSGLLHRIPKSGMWLVWVERLFGVLLLSLAAFYLILVLHPAGLPWLIPVALIAGGVYLGFVEHSEKYGPAFLQVKRLLGATAIALGLLLPSFWPRQSVVWEPYSEEKLAAARESKRPVMIDFYADWCIPCHELERFTYSDPRVIETLHAFSRLKVDLTRIDTPEAEQALERFDVPGVPTLLFFDPRGEEVRDARVTGFISAEHLLEILHSPRLRASEAP